MGFTQAQSAAIDAIARMDSFSNDMIDQLSVSSDRLTATNDDVSYKNLVTDTQNLNGSLDADRLAGNQLGYFYAFGKWTVAGSAANIAHVEMAKDTASNVVSANSTALKHQDRLRQIVRNSVTAQ